MAEQSTTIEHKAFARVGLLGNPSDVYYGRTISFSLGNFWATVQLQPSDDLVINPHPKHDLVQFSSLDHLVSFSVSVYSNGICLIFVCSFYVVWIDCCTLYRWIGCKVKATMEECDCWWRFVGFSISIVKRTRLIFIAGISLFPMILTFLVRYIHFGNFHSSVLLKFMVDLHSDARKLKLFWGFGPNHQSLRFNFGCMNCVKNEHCFLFSPFNACTHNIGLKLKVWHFRQGFQVLVLL